LWCPKADGHEPRYKYLILNTENSECVADVPSNLMLPS
jgi:hypothetical protein